MQTFLPYPSFVKSFKCLDFRRLGKQRVESKQILDALAGRSKGWRNHPATKMWSGHENALKLYHNLCIKEWVARGYVNNMPLFDLKRKKIVEPCWLGDEAFHAAHRSNLLRKAPEYYEQFGWSETDDLPYIWPST